jgi:transcriptional regulator with XRE-family HTH domain
MRFGQGARSLHQERGLSQRALAKRLCVNFSYLSNIEKGRLDFGIIQAKR